MSREPYHFFISPFLSVTRHSYKKALSLGQDHRAKLIANQADPEIMAMLVSFDPVFQSYLNADINLNSVLGNYKGETQTVEELFDLMNSEKLPYWEGQIFYYYPKGTPTATALFPQNKKPFQSGTYEQRIEAIKVLGDKCALDASLNAVSVNILAFYVQIESARLLQQSQGEGAAETMRTLRETARVVMCQEMYGNMGTLMHKHRDNPETVENYFDMEILRTHQDKIIKLVISGYGLKTIKKDMQPGDLQGVKVKNTSTAASGTVLVIYTANSENEGWNGRGIVLNPGDEIEIDEAIFSPVLPFFNVQNQNEKEGNLEVRGL